ncbi:MAG: response regulator transcription factor [Methylophilaceae bacterium]
MFKTLIVEDNTVFRESLNEILRTRFPAMAIAEAVDVKDAMEKIDSFKPDMVFMDVKLPDGNGLNVTRVIMADHADTIVIVITAFDVPEYRQAAFQAGASYFIPKDSLFGEEILSVVETVLNKQNYH